MVAIIAGTVFGICMGVFWGYMEFIIVAIFIENVRHQDWVGVGLTGFICLVWTSIGVFVAAYALGV